MGSGQSKNKHNDTALMIGNNNTTNDNKSCNKVQIPTWMTDVGTQIKDNVEDNVQRRGMIQREVQMSIDIAKARDTLQIFGSIYGIGLFGITSAKVVGKSMPSVVGIPIVIGGVVLGNIADMAYGNKLQRITKEAEYIMEHEQYRFVPPVQAPFYKYYSIQDKDQVSNIPSVGTLFPSNLIARSNSSNSRSSSQQQEEK